MVCAPVRSIISSLFKVYTGYRDTSEIEHGLCACTVDNLSVQAHKQCSISLVPR